MQLHAIIQAIVLAVMQDHTRIDDRIKTRSDEADKEGQHVSLLNVDIVKNKQKLV